MDTYHLINSKILLATDGLGFTVKRDGLYLMLILHAENLKNSFHSAVAKTLKIRLDVLHRE